MNESQPLQSLLQYLLDSLDGDETDLHSVVESFGDRAFGPVLTLCGLFLVTPLGAIPGVPIALGLIIISFALQLLIGRDTPWMPKFIAKIKIKRERLEKTQRIARPWLARIDGLVRPRQSWAAGVFARFLAALIAIILAITLFPLGVVPFGVAIPGIVIIILGLGVTARDGIIMLIGFTLSAMAVYGITHLITL